jgi:hypothetical protein
MHQVNTPLGSYQTLAQACVAEGVTGHTLRKWIVEGRPGYSSSLNYYKNDNGCYLRTDRRQEHQKIHKEQPQMPAVQSTGRRRISDDYSLVPVQRVVALQQKIRGIQRDMQALQEMMQEAMSELMTATQNLDVA